MMNKKKKKIYISIKKELNKLYLKKKMGKKIYYKLRLIKALNKKKEIEKLHKKNKIGITLMLIIKK